MPALLPPVADAHRKGGDWRKIVLDRDSRTVVLPRDCGLDLGGIAKGMAADASVDLLRTRDVGAALVSAGGDLCVLGLPPAAGAWHVFVGEDSAGDVVPLVRGALATSGRTRRSWLQGGSGVTICSIRAQASPPQAVSAR
jgi:thiamine biosynthesis lipoprotein